MKQPIDPLDKSVIFLGSIAFTLFIIAYWPVWKILATKWAASDEYNHAFLTLPIIGHMVWSKRDLLKDGCSTFYTYIGLLLLVLSTAVYFFAIVTWIHTALALAMFFTILSVLVYLAGTQAIKVLIIPLILLLILIPFPNQLYINLTYPLQIKVSQIAEFIVMLFNIPILREGNVMHIPEKSFQVVQACSGLRSIITLLTLSIIMGFYFMKTKISKIILVIASLPTAIIVNIIRVASLIIVYHYFKIDLTEGALHSILGLVIFVMAFSILLLLQKVLEHWENK